MLYVLGGLSILLGGCLTLLIIKYIHYRESSKKKFNLLNSKYSKLKEEYLMKGRQGFYEHKFIGKANVFVQEIERYNNGMSKIRLLNVEGFEGDSNDKRWCVENATENFTSVKKTINIEWLEMNTKDARRLKLEEIEKSLDDEKE